MSKKRGQNEGTIFEERPGRWIASISLGYEVRDGKRQRIRKSLSPAREKRFRSGLRKPSRNYIAEVLLHEGRSLLGVSSLSGSLIR